VLELKIEGDVSEYARKKKCLAVKLTIWGRRGWPDYLFLYPVRRVLFVEFKRPGKEPRKLQEYIHGLLRKYGFEVIKIDSIEEGKAAIDRFVS
jgi:hypothetical protein